MLLEVLGDEAGVELEVVEEAVVDHRADGDLGVWEEPLHGVGEKVRSRVAENLQRARVVERDGRDLAVGGEGAKDVGELAVN